MALVANFQDTVLTNSAVNIIPSLSYVSTWIVAASAVNTDLANAHTISVYRVPSGSYPADQYLVIDNAVILPGQPFNMGINGQALTTNATFQAVADTSGVVNVNLSFVSTN
jgi:hypothetical protein